MTDAATPETATAPEVHDLASATRAIETIIRRETAPPDERDRSQTPNSGDPPEDDDEADGEADDEDEHDPGVIDDDDEEDGDSAEEEPRYKVKVGGEETEVPLKELIKGYQRGADYTRKTMRLVDHRDFILARKAMLYDRLMANKDKVKETLAALPRVQKPGMARDSRNGAAERRSHLMTRLARSGRTEDAARLIEDML